MSKRVVGIGHAEVNHLTVVDRYPEPESRVELASFSIQGGGTTANALATLAALGVPSVYIGKLPDDEFGTYIRRGLESMDIDISAAVTQPERLSSYAFIVLERETRRRTVFYTEGNLDPLRPDEVDLNRIQQADLLIVDGYEVEAQIKAAEVARSNGATVVLDAGPIREGMGELVALADVLVASERYASEVAPRGEIEESLVEIRRLGPKVIVVTMGEEGSVGLEGEKLVRQPPLQVDVMDTTGAGDVYLGGYCYGLLHGWPLERCMQIAAAAAGLSCRDLGARAGLPDLEEVRGVSWQEVHR
jgi:sugar/nucleoside kinase (ribokinase family)